MGRFVDLLVSAYAFSPLVFWVAGSVLAFGIAAHILNLMEGRSFWRPPLNRWLVEGGRFLFCLAVPYLALGGWPRRPYQGLLAPEDMGLVGPGPQWPAVRWLEAAGTGLGLGLVALMVLLLAWIYAWGGLRFSSRPGWVLGLQGLYLEVHWAFYRGGLAVALDDVYAGVFWGLAAAVVEWMLAPSWWRGWQQASRAGYLWLRAALVLISSLLFLLTRNFWVCLGVHWLVAGAFWLVGRRRGQGDG